MDSGSAKKRIAILGSTGSIGTQALQIIDEQPDRFEVSLLTAQNNTELFISQCIKYQPSVAVIGNDAHYLEIKNALSAFPIKVFVGTDAIEQSVRSDDIDIVLTAIVGFAGLKSTLSAIEAGKTIALANKETLVVAGELVAKMAVTNKVNILPVDSEHSAIFQCLEGENRIEVENLILTASGGPFRGKSRQELKEVTLADALKHPNWSMGRKITIDSATLMNKGLEIIEARWLFGIGLGKIKVIVHPQSIIHSMVEFVDGSIKAQMGLPDMRLPIQYALGYPQRLSNTHPRLSFEKYNQLTFEQPDMENFPCLGLAYESGKRGGNASCVMNAANEVAVAAYLEESIRFVQIPEIIEKTMEKAAFLQNCSAEQYYQTDLEARLLAREITKNLIWKN